MTATQKYDKPSDSVFDRCVKIDWEAVWKAIGTRSAHQAECDDRESLLTVIADDQGDLHMDMIRHPKAIECGGGFGTPTFRARTFAGGGRCERIRTALALLALAISEDQPPTVQSDQSPDTDPHEKDEIRAGIRPFQVNAERRAVDRIL